MQFLTRDGCAKWCVTAGLDLDPDHGSPNEPSGPSAHFDIPSDAGRRVALARLLWESIAAPAPQVLLWVTEFGVWPSGEHRSLAESARRAWGAPGLLAEYPGHLVRGGEHEDGISLLVLALVFLWDCWLLLPSSKGSALFVSHDEIGVAYARHETELAPLVRRLELFRG
ncbi:MAG TPA: hypothetical protein VFY49_00825 [Myxococcota bacterium]|nr:hypothetical protein [Myxococcota bacterium]